MDNLASKAKLAVYWNTGFNLFRDLLQFGVMLVLIRIIPPEAYGQFGLVNSIIGFISVFSFSSFIAHSIQIRKIEDIDYQSHFTAGFFIQLFTITLTILIAIFLSFTDTYKEVAWLVAIMALTFILELPTQFKIKQFEKILDWKRLRILHGIGLILSSLFAIIMALLGTGVYALLIPGLLTTIPFIYELFIVNKWRPDWTFNKTRYKDTIKFALVQSGSGITTKAQPLIESSVLTAVIGFYGFGIYGRAFGLARMISEKFVAQLLYATYPVLTSIDAKSEQYKKALSTLVIIIMAFIIPVAIIFSFNAEIIVMFLYGSKWISVIPLLPYAIIIVGLTALNNTFVNIFLSFYKQNLLFIISIISLTANVLLLLLVLSIGIINYLTGLLILQALLLVGNFSFSVLFRLMDLKFILLKFIGMIIIGFIAYIPIYLFITYFDLHNYVNKLSGIFIYFIFYIIQLRLFMKKTFAMIINYLPLQYKIKNIFYIKSL